MNSQHHQDKSRSDYRSPLSISLTTSLLAHCIPAQTAEQRTLQAYRVHIARRQWGGILWSGMRVQGLVSYVVPTGRT
jgi:hypothetical protein